jgi:hypothetical protein
MGLCAGCGDELLLATFTSRVVQLDACRRVGEGSEGCVRAESLAERRLTIMETDPGAYWLYGVPRDGAPERAILGSNDSAGGFLFVDERVQSNSVTGCELITRSTLSLAIDPAAAGEAVGVDDCVGLLGRSVDTISQSAACDVNVPPQAIVQTVRRRYELPGPDGLCAPVE